jgi:1-acyl-sn-glycerol-3-phosphate acyltransferase
MSERREAPRAGTREQKMTDALDADRIARPEPPFAALRRRLAGRYPVDPFGLDPQLADLCIPLLEAVVRVRVEGADHVPATGPAVIVSNRGFGVIEPAALGVAVERATGRRLRVVGAPDFPIARTVTRRLGAIASSAPDVAAALHAGHLVGIPLGPTWLRTGAGDAPHGVARALTLAPIIPAAVRGVGLLGGVVGSWEVTFGPLVTLSHPYDPGQPLSAARFTEAMRRAVAALLEAS